MQPVDIALVGHGAWGEKIATTLGRLPHARLAAVCDPSEQARARARASVPGARVTASLDELLGAGAPRAAIIATPPATHAALAQQALAAGLDVMVEKPMALRLDEARELEQVARELGRVLMVGHILEYHPAVLELRRRIAEGELGELELVVSERLGASPRRHENAWWSLGPHDVSVLRLLTGRSATRVRVAGWASDASGRPDVIAARLEVGEGALGLAHLSLVETRKVRRIVVVGSEAVAVFDDQRTGRQLVIFERAEVTGLSRVLGLARAFDPARQSRSDVLDGVAPDLWLPLVGGREIRVEARPALEVEAEHFLAGVLGHDRVRSDAASGREVVAVLEAGQRSLDGRSGEDVSLG